MAKATRIPPLNPLRFIPANDGLPAAYNTYPFDRGFFYQSIRSYQERTDYLQKFAMNDRIAVYFDTLAPSAVLHICDDAGNDLTTTGAGAYVLAGNTINIGGTDYTYNTFNINFRIADLAPFTEFQKFFYLVIECEYGGGDSVYYVSECIACRKDGWEDTMLLEVTHSVNAFDVLFEQLHPTFRYRIECDITNDVAQGSHDTMFEDQGYQVRNLQSIPYRLFYLIVGGNAGVPQYIIDKVNRLLACDAVRIEGTRYVKDLNASYTMTTAENYPMRAVRMQLREYDNSSGWVYVGGSVIHLFEIPSSGGSIIYPFSNNVVSMSDGLVYTGSAAKIIEDAAGLTAWLAYLNGSVAADFDLGGTFSVVTDGGREYLQYQNADGESYAPFGQMYAWSRYLSYTVTTTTVDDPYAFGFAAYAVAGAVGRAVVGWGDTAVAEYVAVYGTDAAPTHTYATAGTYNLRIFHAGANLSTSVAIRALNFSYAGPALITAIASTTSQRTAPSGLWSFTMLNQNLSGAPVDLFSLDACRATLIGINIANNHINSFVLSLVSFGLLQSPGYNLQTLIVTGNAIPVSQINTLIDNFSFNDAYASTAGLFHLKQTPAATPGSSQLTFLGMLSGTYGWTVLHD